MTMTRKDFVSLAKDLRWFRLSIQEDWEGDIETEFGRLVGDIARTCKAANPNFDHDRFRVAVYAPVKEHQ